MATIRKVKGSKYWIVQFGDKDGKLRTQSTRVADEGTPAQRADARYRAKHVADTFECTARGQTVSESILRESMARTFEAVNNEKLFQPTILEFFENYLREFEMQVENKQKSPATHIRYKGIIERFLNIMGSRCEAPFDTLQPEDFAKFRDERLKAVGAKTLRNDLKCLNFPLPEAVKLGRLPLNPIPAVKIPTARKSMGLPFAFGDVKKLLAYCRQPEFAIEGTAAE